MGYPTILENENGKYTHKEKQTLQWMADLFYSNCCLQVLLAAAPGLD